MSVNTKNNDKWGLMLPSLPIDDNRRSVPILYGAVVDANGDIVKYLPIKAADAGDGTAIIVTQAPP